MESTAQPGKTHLQSLLSLNGQLSACNDDASAANLMAEDLLDFFETANHDSQADRVLSTLYFPEQETRAHILQEYTFRAKKRTQDLLEQTQNLIDTMKREGIIV